MARRIVLYGASGYVGQLVALHLVAAAEGADGRHSHTVHARGPDAYSLTSLLLEGADLILASGDNAGVGAGAR